MNRWKSIEAGGQIPGGGGPLLCALAVLFLFSLFGTDQGVSAFEIKTGNEDLRVNWDNTIRYNVGLRVKGQDPGLLKNPNIDDGNRNFSQGIVTNRVDLLSELDAVFKRDYGLRFSGAFWYDQRYHDSLGNNSEADFSHDYCPSCLEQLYPDLARAMNQAEGEIGGLGKQGHGDQNVLDQIEKGKD